MTLIGEFRPGNKTIWVVFDEESYFSGPRTSTLNLDQVVEESVPYTNICFNIIYLQYCIEKQSDMFGRICCFFVGWISILPWTVKKSPSRVFGHNSLLRTLTGTRIGGNDSYQPPGAP